jgi:hypothetical protein
MQCKIFVNNYYLLLNAYGLILQPDNFKNMENYNLSLFLSILSKIDNFRSFCSNYKYNTSTFSEKLPDSHFTLKLETRIMFSYKKIKLLSPQDTP